MIIFRRARGAVGRSLGAVTQALDYLAADGQVQGMPTGGDRGRATQHAGPHQNVPSMPVRVVMGKSTDGAAEQSEPVAEKKQSMTDEMGSGTASGTTEGSETSGSHANDESEMGEDEFQNVLLAAAMKHVAAEGWTTKALQLAAQDLKLSPMFAGVCSDKDLVQYFIKSSNDRLFERISSSGPEFHNLPVPDKVKLAVRWRLEMLSPYINTWPQAMALMAKRENAQTAFYLMWGLVTKLSLSIEPQGTEPDPSRYSKLFALQTIYTSTELYMLTDFSPGHADTWQALDRRVADLLMLRSGAQQVEQFVLEHVNKMVTFGRP